MEMKLKKRNYNGFNHEVVAKKFDGDVTYVNDFCLDIQGVGYTPCSVYRAANPDKSKGHKEFMVLFFTPNGQMYVSGRTRRELNKERKLTGLACMECGEVMVSIHRHDYNMCSCPNQAFADGGRDYFRAGAKSLAKTQTVVVDLLTDKITLAGDEDAKKSKE